MEDNNLKYNLLDKLISIDDGEVLQKISDFLGDINLEKTAITLTDAQRKMLIKSEEDIKSGNVITDKDLNDEEHKWLNG